jgi:hypothetical protein
MVKSVVKAEDSKQRGRGFELWVCILDEKHSLHENEKIEEGRQTDRQILG